MSTRYSDWIRENESKSGYGWVKYRLCSSGTVKTWRFWELENFRKVVAENTDNFMWAMTFSNADGAFYYRNGKWHRSSGARLAFLRDESTGKVHSYRKDDEHGEGKYPVGENRHH